MYSGKGKLIPFPHFTIIMVIKAIHEVIILKTVNEIIERAKTLKPKKIAVAVAQDSEVLSAVEKARMAGIAGAILVGSRGKIEEIAEKSSISLTEFEIIDIEDVKEACAKAVSLITEGRAHILMKGIIDTSIFLKAVLNPESYRLSKL
jgi:phosphate butyryltransferase